MLAGLLGNVVPAGLDYVGVVDLPSYLVPALPGILASLIGVSAGSRGQSPSPRQQRYRAIAPDARAGHQRPGDPHHTDRTCIAGGLWPDHALTAAALLRSTLPGRYRPADVSRAHQLAVRRAPACPSPAVLHVPLGLLACAVIRRRYSPGKTLPTTASNRTGADKTSA